MIQAGPLGVHWIADAAGCPPAHLVDAPRITTLLEALAEVAGLTALGEPLVRLTSSGLVGVLLLAESHASVHTDREHGTAFVDVFSCVATDTAGLADCVRDALAPERLTARNVPRGPA
ncbi:MAG: S-adenosylmethionine decarboxylase [Myxococcota bacterium]